MFDFEVQGHEGKDCIGWLVRPMNERARKYLETQILSTGYQWTAGGGGMIVDHEHIRDLVWAIRHAGFKVKV